MQKCRSRIASSHQKFPQISQLRSNTLACAHTIFPRLCHCCCCCCCAGVVAVALTRWLRDNCRLLQIAVTIQLSTSSCLFPALRMDNGTFYKDHSATEYWVSLYYFLLDFVFHRKNYFWLLSHQMLVVIAGRKVLLLHLC